MSATNYLEDQFLLASLTGNTFTGAANVYVALYSTAPTDAGGGTELAGSGYARQEAVFTVSAGNGQAVNDAAVVFGNATADWLTARAYGIVDADTAGNILYTGALAPTQTLKDTYNLTFGAGNIVITID